MRTSFVSAAVLAFVSTAFAQTAGFDAITAPAKDITLKVGSTFDIIWEPASVKGTVSIVLLEGDTPSTLQLGPTLASGVENQNGKLAWTIPASVGTFETYGIKIQLDSDPSTFQYSNPFHISGSVSSSSSASASKSTTKSVSKSTSVSVSTSAHASSSASGSASLTAPASTKTITLSRGTAYTTTTSKPAVTHARNSTVISTTSVPAIKSASNLTLSTTVVFTTKPGSLSTATVPTTTGGPAIQSVTPSSATANIARGGIALLGGLAIALFL